MGQITAALVKKLREKTGAGMMDCKKALAENDGDLEAAVDWLRKKGLAAAAKKAGRVAAEGLVGIHVDGLTGTLVEVNAETDFVARNDVFQGFVTSVTACAQKATAGSAALDIAALEKLDYPGTGRTVGEELTHQIATIGENMSLRRTSSLSVSDGVVAAYMHNATAPGLGKIGVLVALESAGSKDVLARVGKQIAMHVAAANPIALNRDQVDTSILDRERGILIEQARASGKPENIIEKMVEGRLRKFYEENCLVDQIFVVDNETKISKVVAATEKEAGAPVALTGFIRFALGEGIAKKEEDFAAEVAAAAGKG